MPKTMLQSYIDRMEVKLHTLVLDGREQSASQSGSIIPAKEPYSLNRKLGRLQSFHRLPACSQSL
jgi:hypothetical protein